MISESLKRLAVDSNVILSAVIGKSALQIFARAEIEFVTTEFNLQEVREYLPRLASKYRLEEQLLLWQLKMLPIRSFPEKYYESHIFKAGELLKKRDEDNIHLAALALKENIPLWSNDKDFEKLSILVYTTAQIPENSKKRLNGSLGGDRGHSRGEKSSFDGLSNKGMLFLQIPAASGR